MTAAHKLRPAPSFEIVLSILDDESYLLTVDSELHSRTYVVEWKLYDCDDRMALVKWAPTEGDYCALDLPPHEVRELERFLECDDDLHDMCERALSEMRELHDPS